MCSDRLLGVLRATSLLSRRYRIAARPFQVRTADGVVLRGHRLGELGAPAMVFCHGFLGWHRKPGLVKFQEELARWFAVYAFDFRGHGESSGLCEFGAAEHVDVDAVVGLARSEGAGRVVTFGGSMGGIAVIRHAALIGGVDAVVTVSTPAVWHGHDSIAVRRLIRLTGTSYGRWALGGLGVRPAAALRWVEPPAEVVGAISPTPLVIVHGRDDHFFDEEQAWLLYRNARSPKRLLLATRFGHAEDGYTPEFARQVTAAVLPMVAPAGIDSSVPS
jgi:pimeloyl-ACP methyl ester carboxylesterase